MSRAFSLLLEIRQPPWPWIDGVSPITVLDAYAAAVALCITAYFGAKQQHAYSPILRSSHAHTRADKARVGIVALILTFAIVTNVVINVKFNHLLTIFHSLVLQSGLPSYYRHQ